MAISSTDNRIIKHVRSLSHKKRRDAERLFVIEGERFVRDAPCELIEYCVVSEDYQGDIPNVTLYAADKRLFSELSDAVTPQGILAVCRMPVSKPEAVIKPNCLLLALEGIQDPGNLGTMIRTAAAAGVDGVLISKDSADVFGAKAVRASASAIFQIPISHGLDMPRILGILKQNGVCLYAAELSESRSAYDADYCKSTAFVIGNEANGLSPESSALCGERIRIPMTTGVESLNAAVAAAVLIYEAVRQRIVINKS